MPDIVKIHEILTGLYPDALCSLAWDGDPWRLLVMGVLSAQCTDARVNLVTPALFARYPDVRAMAMGDAAEIGGYIHSCGFWRVKSENLHAAAVRIVTVYDGQVPDTMEELLTLPGVGRKVANLVLGDAFQKPGIVADTHCIRINGRLGFYPETLKDPTRIEKILDPIVPKPDQAAYCHRMVLFGREFCTAKSPKCPTCPLKTQCNHLNSLPNPPTYPK